MAHFVDVVDQNAAAVRAGGGIARLGDDPFFLKLGEDLARPWEAD